MEALLDAGPAIETFGVRFLGETLQCLSPHHAATIKSADEILAGVASVSRTADELAEMAEMLIRYGQIREAQIFGHWAKRRRGDGI